MTKIKSWWKKVSFWMKIKGLLMSLGIGSEVTLFAVESHPHWKVVALVATLIGIVITQLIQDKNNNGIADIFEDE